MKKYFELVIFLFSSFISTAQNNLPAVYSITNDTAKDKIRFPDSCWQILADRNSQWTIDQVSSPPVANGFLRPSNGNNAWDVAVKTYWFRYRLKNNMQKEVRIAIPAGYERDEIFVTDSSGKWHHQNSGYFQPWSKRDGLRWALAMPLTIRKGGEVLIYERLTTNYHFGKTDTLHSNFRFKNDIVDHEYLDEERLAQFISESMFFSLVFGVLLFAALLNLFFFIVVREKIYLYFALFVIGVGSMRFAARGHMVMGFFREQPWLGSYIIYIALVVLFFSLIQFARSYLSTPKYFPVWDKFLIAVGIYIPLIALAGLFIRPVLNFHSSKVWDHLTEWSFNATTVIILITLLLYIRRSEKALRLVTIAALPLLLFWLSFFWGGLSASLGIATPSRLAWVYKWSGQIEQLCVAWFAVIFSWILLLRFIQLRKEVVQQSLEKERLAKEKEMERAQLIEQQKIELEKTVEERTAELKYSLQELKSTQAQLIQSEKMASLGELTAGIAHEIQNPLNFINNFSEINKELVDELKSELTIGNLQQATEIADDIKDNSQKINHHGKRADAIVKGMLQHSRVSSGQKELTDINALADEYLRLAYHGLRARDKTFNAKFETDLDKTIEKINVVPQDIGRVLLNLINNAFYAVDEKKRQLDGSLPTGQAGYEPCVSITTRKVGNHVEITVKDNGNGIQQKVLNKIFQPFFTTKPTGAGTGLGLSLSYDIVKAHGGEIKVETNEGQASEFVIYLPAT